MDLVGLEVKINVRIRRQLKRQQNEKKKGEDSKPGNVLHRILTEPDYIHHPPESRRLRRR